MTKEEMIEKIQQDFNATVEEWGNQKDIDSLVQKMKQDNSPQFMVNVIQESLRHGYTFTFPNQWKADITDTGYGKKQGLLELAVMDSKRELRYDTPVTHDVLGFLSPEEAYDNAKAVSELEPEPQFDKMQELRNQKTELEEKLNKLDMTNILDAVHSATLLKEITQIDIQIENMQGVTHNTQTEPIK